jgi:uncharacterized protein (DUF1697 family)
MPQYIAFLRGINLGKRRLPMSRLKTAFEGLGFDDVATFIASGNVVFKSRSRAIPSLQRRIAEHLRDALGYDVETFIRTGAAVAAIARYRPFPEPRMRAAHVVCVGFLAVPLGTAGVKALMGLRTPNDDFHVHGTEVYWLCGSKQAESVFSNAVFEKTTKAKATFRGMRTVVNLSEKFGFETGTG